MRPPFGPCFLCPLFPPPLLSIIFLASSANLAHALRVGKFDRRADHKALDRLLDEVGELAKG